VAARGNNPHIPSEEIANQLEKPVSNKPTVPKQEHHAANPVYVPSDDLVSKLDAPATKEELLKKAEELNK